MEKIILQRENVVKEVLTEEAAADLEKKGFKRIGMGELAQLEKDSAEVILQRELNACHKELDDTQEKLKEATAYAEAADKQIDQLKNELKGTQEQLEAATQAARSAETASSKKK